MAELRKSTYVNGQVYEEYFALFDEIAKTLQMNVKDLKNKYLCNIENMLRVRGEHRLANALYSS